MSFLKAGLVAALGLTLVSPALATTLLATFDTLPEGDAGSVITDGGITFSHLDRRLTGPPQTNFTIEATDTTLFGPTFTPPNYLNTGGYVGGPGFSFGRFGSARITFGSVRGYNASMDIFSFLGDPNSLTLEAWLGGSPVASSSVTFAGSGIGRRGLTINRVAFDELRLVASGPQDSGVVFIGIDNVRVTLAPEPASLGLLGLGLLPLLRRRKR
jgi:MYXO-CTERM domain-containing protein